MAGQDLSKVKLNDLLRELKRRGLNGELHPYENELNELQQLARKMHKNVCDFQNGRRVKNKDLSREEVDQSSNILKMPVEIIEYIFDYLNLKDLSAVSGTCKQMQQLAGRVYQQSYSAICPLLNHSQKNWMVDFAHPKYDYYIDFKYFIPFIDTICLYLFDYLDLQLKFHQLKILAIINANFDYIEIDGMKGGLRKLEYLQICNCKMNESFLEELIFFAPNLKRLYLSNSNAGKRWLERSYPTLEHLEINSSDIVPITKLLTLNPNIRKFGINALNLWENRSLLKASEVKLEDLAIEIRPFNRFEEIKVPFWQLLDDLHQLGVYTRLNLFSYEIFNQHFVDEIANLTALKRLRLSSWASFDYVALSGLSHLEDISFPDSRYITDKETVVTTFENLKFIHLGISNTSHVKLFMGGNRKLESIRIDWFADEFGNTEDDIVLNLFELNKERAKLANAKEITLYVRQSVYLATKRATWKTDLEFIKLRRIYTLNQREFDFRYPDYFDRTPLYIHRFRQ